MIPANVSSKHVMYHQVLRVLDSTGDYMSAKSIAAALHLSPSYTRDLLRYGRIAGRIEKSGPHGKLWRIRREGPVYRGGGHSARVEVAWSVPQAVQVLRAIEALEKELLDAPLLRGEVSKMRALHNAKVSLQAALPAADNQKGTP